MASLVDGAMGFNVAVGEKEAISRLGLAGSGMERLQVSDLVVGKAWSSTAGLQLSIGTDGKGPVRLAGS